MNETALERFWELLGWVLALKSEVFAQINTLPNGTMVAIIVVIAAGLSQAVAHSTILFVNRVKPVRFIFGLIIEAILFAFGYLFLVVSTWAIGYAPFTIEAPFGELARTLAFGYAPLIFSLFGAMPYLGEPILSLLSLWQLLAMVIGVADVSNTNVWQAFGTVALGWITLAILQRTIGQPIAQFGHWIACKTTGVKLITNRVWLKSFVQGLRLDSLAHPTKEVALPDGKSAVISSEFKPEKTVKPKQQQSIHLYEPSPLSTASTTSHGATDITTTNIITKNRRYQLSSIVKQLRGLAILASVTFVAVVLLSPIRYWWFAWYVNLDEPFKLIFNLVWIGIIALVTTAILSPVEALGWWAGWYDDFSKSSASISAKQTLPTAHHKTTRYVIYLDGISQSKFEFTPDIQDFLAALEPALPEDVELIKDIMVYSVRDKPLTVNRPLSFLWRLADSFRFKNPASWLGLLVNIRNSLIVAVSADKRYGPIYNFGIARLMYQALIQRGYQPNSRRPITLIGFSGGGQMAVAATPYLQRALNAPIEVISLGGVISGNVNILKLEHLYHLSGEKDMVERIGPVMFPRRWTIFFLSYWNRAKRMGKVSLISLGPVGHQVPGGIMDPEQRLPDGRTHLQQTIDWIVKILHDTVEPEDRTTRQKLSDYERFRSKAFNCSESYPIEQSLSTEYYRGIAPWMGRLILPAKDQRIAVQGVLFEVHHAPSQYKHLVGQIVILRLSDEPETRSYVDAVTKDVHFSPQAEYSARQGNIHPTRLNHWRQVNPLESLAGSHGVDDVMVMLPESVIVHSSDNDIASYILYISHDPVQITGRYYALVKFLQPIPDSDLFKVVHFNRASRQFDGLEETVKMPSVVPNRNNTCPSTTQNIEQSYLNETGWYIYGAQDESGKFIVQALAPRRLLQVKPEQIITGIKPAKKYLKKEVWDNLVAKKGRINSVLLKRKTTQAENPWVEGKRALLIHTYGGIGGKKTEPAAKSPLYFGHFAYGIASVVREPLSDELRFEIVYHQVYTQNSEGLIAGSLHWSRYMGDRNWGWLGLRPVCDIIVELDEFTGNYETNRGPHSPLDRVIRQLEVMAARYRIGDGTGGTFVGPANNCVQDANQALYAALRQISLSIRSNPNVEQWKKEHPQQLSRLKQLEQLTQDFKHILLPWGTARADWKNHAEILGSTLEDNPIQNLIRGLITWRTLLPRLTSEEVVQVFLQQDASVWVLRTNQVGGKNPEIEPVAPMTL
ncbi:MAG: CAAX protease [Microcoleaceae cyanobacterium]